MTVTTVVKLARDIATLDRLLREGGISQEGYAECVAILRREPDYDHAVTVARAR